MERWWAVVNASQSVSRSRLLFCALSVVFKFSSNVSVPCSVAVIRLERKEMFQHPIEPIQ